MVFEDYQDLNFSALDSRLVKSYAEHFWTEEKLRLNKFIYSVASYYNINKLKAINIFRQFCKPNQLQT